MLERTRSSCALLRLCSMTVCGLTLYLAPAGCVVDGVCYDNSECPAGQCCGDDGSCEPCACPRGDTPLSCPDEMVSVGDAYCVDRYEASRPDATATAPGTDESRATSRAGVLPWETNNAGAEAACQAAGKQLCTPQQWQCACQGAAATAYSYGDAYEPETCNGIDTFCFCDGACSTLPECPFAGCYHQCGADFRLLPTGSMAGCVSKEGAFDLNGNVWEHVRGGSALTVRGGAFNCGDSRKLHRCDYIPGDWAPSARGFRCCLVPGAP